MKITEKVAHHGQTANILSRTTRNDQGTAICTGHSYNVIGHRGRWVLQSVRGESGRLVHEETLAEITVSLEHLRRPRN